ncbi:hypothetical protein ICN30_10420 [Polynucleobacter sp. 31A-FELB]|uniref:hypothetical protein n=1 Tax=Polynucleobacter sp. 31A-FELB TaxID=2689096 RepID=UPI001C0D6A94|nr:hypothetical protein [Polynucleobacter sp. 31A-FELB]MBU3588248.1 hypothetical protein [Polynucleobacter sp. 31A-FELB]
MKVHQRLTREALHRDMPLIAQLVAQYRAVFGPGLKVLWAKEGEFEVGKLPQVRSYCGPFESSKPPKP